MKKILLSLVLMSVCLCSMQTIAQNVEWNFLTASPNTNTATNVTIGDVSQGNNNGTTTLLTSTSASSGYSGASGANNAGAAARIGALNTGASGSAYFEFTITPASGFAFTISTISFGTRSTATGPAAFTIRRSTDGYTTDITTGTITTSPAAWALQSPSISTSSASATTFRIYGYNGSGSPAINTANWRIDDLKLTVTAAAITITPSTASISGLNTTGSQSFTVDGANLTGDLTVTAPANFQVSKDNSSFSGSVTVTVTSGSPSGRVSDIKAPQAAIPVYVRVDPAVAAANPATAVSGTLTISGGSAATQNISLSGSGPLPVTFSSFVARQSGSRVELSWQTSFERDNEGFEIERSKNAVDFNTLGFVKGIGDFVGKSNYSFTDETPLKGINYYRLKQKDFSGKTDYSRTISVVNLNDLAEEIVISPNPAIEKVRFEFAEINDVQDISMFDTKGQKIKTFDKNTNENNIENLPAGSYIIKAQMSDGRCISKKIMKL
jgi:hypothetical protein